MGSRSGADLATLMTRAALELDYALVLIPIDGIGVYDHIYWKAMSDAAQRCSDSGKPTVCRLRYFFPEPARQDPESVFVVRRRRSQRSQSSGFTYGMLLRRHPVCGSRGRQQLKCTLGGEFS